MPQAAAIPPVIIPLPGGLSVSGVCLFAVRLAGRVAEAGGRAALLLHRAAGGTAPIDIPMHPAVLRIDLSHLPPIEEAHGDLRPYLPVYRDTVAEFAADGLPPALLLGQHESVFAVAAALSQTVPELMRCVGIAHSDNTYDAAVLTRYEPLLHRLVGVSDALELSLRERNASRAADIRQIGYGVPVPDRIPAREPLGGRPLRLLYAGRLEHRQKRVLALPKLSAELDRRGVSHELTIAGDGPARDELRAACQGRGSIRMVGAQPPERVRSLLAHHDAFVLPSRFEGLSIAMLEALAQGCVPVCAPSRSGTAQAVAPGVTGAIAAVEPDADEAAAAPALADAIDSLRRRDLPEMAARCHARATECFSLDRHADAWSGLLRGTLPDEPRTWPADRPCAMDSGTSDGNADLRNRLRDRLRALAGRPVCIHGTGSTARALAGELADANVVAVCDDDRQRHGAGFLGWPVIAPIEAAAAGAGDVIILAALHEQAIWDRREIYTAQGIRVHRLTADKSNPAMRPPKTAASDTPRRPRVATDAS
ncbi:MAG: glycosyltransferase family 4 protein [Planctomycetota bacterium]